MGTQSVVRLVFGHLDPCFGYPERGKTSIWALGPFRQDSDLGLRSANVALSRMVMGKRARPYKH